jgi:hypothetical protein
MRLVGFPSPRCTFEFGNLVPASLSGSLVAFFRQAVGRLMQQSLTHIAKYAVIPADRSLLAEEFGQSDDEG